LEKGDDIAIGRDVRGGRAGFEREEVYIPVVQDDEYVLMTCRRSDRKSAGEVGGGPLTPVEGDGVAGKEGFSGNRRMGCDNRAKTRGWGDLACGGDTLAKGV
jgi:hypothetical protein